MDQQPFATTDSKYPVPIVPCGHPEFREDLLLTFRIPVVRGIGHFTEDISPRLLKKNLNKVLFVDDDRVTHTLIDDVLVDSGYVVTHAISGSEALQMIGQDAPDFLIVNREMSLTSGLHVCETLRRTFTDKYLYIILVTSQDHVRYEVQAIAAGADSLLGKPIVAGELLSKLQAGGRILELQLQLKELGAHDPLTEQLEQSQEAFRQMQVQLTHAARLSTLGEMAAEMAHELNQPLCAILNYTKAIRNILAEEGHVEMDSLREWNEEIANIALSAAEVVKRLRSFSRPGESPRTLCRIEKIVEEALNLVGADLQKAGVTVETTFADSVPPICVDHIEIQQVLVNLLKNAVESMETAPNPMRRIKINTSVCSTAVNVAVSDSGIGLPPGNETTIFHPFITTKPEGLGMGLSIARTIIEAYGGRIWATSNPDQGTTCIFSLPFERTESAAV
jgi:C4-dicarboxylate-specific signal transduction histidine kinase